MNNDYIHINGHTAYKINISKNCIHENCGYIDVDVCT